MNKYDYLAALKQRLTEEDCSILQAVYEPQAVMTPPEDSRRSISVLPDGEIRVYGYGMPTAENPEGIPVFYASADCGLSWKLHKNTHPMQSFTYVPNAKRYIGIKPETGDGLWVFVSDIGPDDPNPRVVRVTDLPAFDAFSPACSAYTDRIWLTAQMRVGDYESSIPYFFYSDSFGETWQTVAVESIPFMPVTYPDKGPRWVNCGVEPIAEELDKHTMMMLLRNGWDAFYVTYSHDGGETWSPPKPSTFYGHATTPYILRLSDGRVLTFWNNTKILPEAVHRHQVPNLPDCIIEGVWEDVFTNRDAAHGAISEDGGKNWLGYREVMLNPYRNNPDFRTVGAEFSWTDKSVHQFQAIELPYGKIMVSIGQSPAVRKLVLFDVNWLYETQRTEDFRRGLAKVTTHQYLYSCSGSGSDVNFGHCAWNRISGAVMVPDPEDPRKECVHISRLEDPRLLTPTQGVVWNFPMAKAGRVTADVRLVADRLRFALSDRWHNACDDTATDTLPYYFELDTLDIGTGFVTLRVDFDIAQSYADVYADDRLLFRIPRHGDIATGISYAMIQCIAPCNSEGLYLRRLEKK